jgi:hypothetical protein
LGGAIESWIHLPTNDGLATLRPCRLRDLSQPSGPLQPGQELPGLFLVEALTKLKAGAKLEDFAVHKTAASRKASPKKYKKRRRAKL